MMPQHAHAQRIIPSRPPAFKAHATLYLVNRVLANQIEDDLLEQGEILWRMVFAYRTAYPLPS